MVFNMAIERTKVTSLKNNRAHELSSASQRELKGRRNFLVQLRQSTRPRGCGGPAQGRPPGARRPRPGRERATGLWAASPRAGHLGPRRKPKLPVGALGRERQKPGFRRCGRAPAFPRRTRNDLQKRENAMPTPTLMHSYGADAPLSRRHCIVAASLLH